MSSGAALPREREGFLPATLPTANASANTRQPASLAGAGPHQPLGRLVSEAAPATVGAVNNVRQQVGSTTGWYTG